MVELSFTKLYIMHEFFRINMQSFEKHDCQQLKILAGMVDKSKMDAWLASIVKTMKALKRFQSLIPPIIRDNYTNIIGGGFGYEEFRREFKSINNVE